MDLVRVASQPSGLTPSARARPSPRAADAQRSCVGSSCFSDRIACANCAASWTVSTEWHRCWRLTCFAHTFLRDALRHTDLDRVSGMCWACTLWTSSSQLTCWFNTWWEQRTEGAPDPQVCSLHVCLDGWQTFSAHTSVFSPSW